MFKKLFLLILFLVIVTPAQAVVSWPPEVKPEQGRASARTQDIVSVGGHFGAATVNITFWNVGEQGGGNYGKASVTITNSDLIDNSRVPDTTFQGSFSGGPDGVITLEGPASKIKLSLIDGANFEITYTGKTTLIPLENPEIFSKYRWSMDQSVPDLEIKKGKYEVETIGSARFGDLSGQVEINIPNPDGTYDEQAWDTAKLDMELPPGTRIIVREKSGLILVFPDTQTNITVGPGTEIILVSPDPQKSMISLPWGILKANVKKMMKDGSMEIEMSQAVAGIKGTQFILNETKTESSVMVIEGTVKFTSKVTGKSVDVSKGESVVATSKGLSEKTTFDPVTEEKKWQKLTDGFKKTDPNILGNMNIIYILGGIIITAAIIGFLLIKVRCHKK